MPPTTRKSLRGRSKRGRERRFEPRIKFTSRPHLVIHISNRGYNALLDSGSEISLINKDTAQELASEGFDIQGEKGRVQLANGSEGETLGNIRLPVRWQNRTVIHDFIILPYTEDTIIVGIDLQARLQIGIPPPPEHRNQKLLRCSATGGLAVQTLEERRELENFLREELRQFENVHGVTDKVQNVI